MIDDPNPGLRQEMQASLDVVAPQVAGLEDFLQTGFSDGAAAIIKTQITNRSRRRDLIANVLHLLDLVVTSLLNLQADGYPTPPVLDDIPEKFKKEITDKITELSRAATIFSQEISVGDKATIDAIHQSLLANTASIVEAVGPQA